MVSACYNGSGYFIATISFVFRSNLHKRYSSCIYVKILDVLISKFVS